MVYAELLKNNIEKYNVDVFLVNTGWIGGSAMSDAKRISIKNTRTMITSILDNSISESEFEMENYCSAAGGILHIQVDASYIYSQTFWGGYDNIFYTPTLTATSIMKTP